MGRSRLIWLKDIENDLSELKVKRWRQNAKDRQDWASFVNEANAFKMAV
jgi:hypothetical protein